MKNKPVFRLNREAITTVIVFLCGLLFLFSALDKITDYGSFRTQAGKSPILAGYEGVVAWAVPTGEMVITLLMVITCTRLIGLYSFFTLMLLFIGYIILLSRVSPDLPCGCNFLTEQLSPNAHILLNGLFAVMAASGALLYNAIDITHRKKGGP